MPHAPRVVLVTGGAGFIGSNFLLRMVPRYPEVRFVNLDALTYAGNLLNLRAVEDAPNYAFVHGDVADAELVRRVFAEEGVTTVVHFAAESHVDRSILDPMAFVRTNVLGTGVLLEAARHAWADDGGGFDPERHRFHHVSTDEVFGELGDDDAAFDEATPYAPRSPYAASKAASDHLARSYFHTYGLPVTVSSCSNNYGPFQLPEKLLPLVIRNAAAGEPIPVYGRGHNVRDWIHVADHAEALDCILRDGRPGEAYGVGAREEQQNIAVVRHLADLVDEELDRPEGTARALITHVADRPGHDWRYAMNPAKIEAELGWRPRIPLEAGLRDTVRWYLHHGEWLDAVLDESYRDYYRRQYGDWGSEQ